MFDKNEALPENSNFEKKTISVPEIFEKKELLKINGKYSQKKNFSTKIYFRTLSNLQYFLEKQK